MTQQHVISQLLKSDSRYTKNHSLLKKIIITTYLGRLRVNGLAPDNKVSIADYLFDQEDVLFDYTRLSLEKKALFYQWLFEPHQKEKKITYFSDTSVNESRGFTAAVTLSWWGRLLNWVQNRFSELWKIADLNLSLNYQLTGIEVCHGKDGSLIGFKQFFVPRSGTKYKAEDDRQIEPLGNTKRVLITDQLVDQLTQIDLKNLNLESVCKKPHPQSIQVEDYATYHAKMQQYRQTQKYTPPEPWYVRAWRRFFSFFSFFSSEKTSEKIKPVDDKPKLLYETKTVKIFIRELTQEILVQEKRPNIENLVFCGGGGKIFAHIGVWKALCEANIRPKRFAGSSAGAIMALLCYLNFSADEITDLFQHFKQEHLVLFDIDINGLSDPNALKTTLDYAISYKINQLVAKYKIPYPEGKITFETLDNLKKLCPGCGIGEELTVTATKKLSRETRYFSLTKSPQFEVSEAGKISASIPPVYRGTKIGEDEYTDGGVSSNLPTEVFLDDKSTWLESEYGNNLKVLAVQFNNGVERAAIDRREHVYRENFFLNWLYGFLTGVSDPASGWEQDRIKLRNHSSQSLLLDVDNISATSFTVEEEVRNRVIQKAYETTKNYLAVSYVKNEDQTYENEEWMYSSFLSLGDLLSYCCYRDDKDWFEVVNNLIVHSSLPNRAALIKQSLELRALYFRSKNEDTKIENEKKPLTFFGNSILQNPLEIKQNNHTNLLAIFPIFLKISHQLVKSTQDKRVIETARHSLSLQAPFQCLGHLDKLRDNFNVVLHIFIVLLKELRQNPNQKVYDSLKALETLLHSGTNIYKEEYFGKWDLSLFQCWRTLQLFTKNKQDSLSKLLDSLRQREEPLQTIVNGTYYDDFSDGAVEEEPKVYNY